MYIINDRGCVLFFKWTLIILNVLDNFLLDFIRLSQFLLQNMADEALVLSVERTSAPAFICISLGIFIHLRILYKNLLRTLSVSRVHVNFLM